MRRRWMAMGIGAALVAAPADAQQGSGSQRVLDDLAGCRARSRHNGAKRREAARDRGPDARGAARDPHLPAREQPRREDGAGRRLSG